VNQVFSFYVYTHIYMYSAEINEECSIRFNYRWPREQYAWALTFLLLTFRNELVQYSPISQSDDIELV